MHSGQFAASFSSQNSSFPVSWKTLPARTTTCPRPQCSYVTWRREACTYWIFLMWFVDPFLLRLALERYSAFFAYRISFSGTQNIDVEFHPARENSLHFATSDDVGGISAEIPRWWRVTSLIWVVLRICRAAREINFNQSEGLHSFLVDLKTILRWHGCSRFAPQFFC